MIGYITATLACALCYWLGGMTVFDAFAHSLTTVSTGGFKLVNQAMGHILHPRSLWCLHCYHPGCGEREPRVVSPA